MIAGAFSFITVDNVSAVHFIILGAAGTASATVTSDPIVANDFTGTRQFHNVVLTVFEPFTLHEITVKGQIDDTADECDKILTHSQAFPVEYTNVTQANVDDKTQMISNEHANRIVDGDDLANPQTWSQNQDDRDNGVGVLTFAEPTKIVTQVTFIEQCDVDSPDYSAIVTYYLSGVDEGDFLLSAIEGNVTTLRDRD